MEDLNLARELLQRDQLSLVLVNRGKIIFTSSESSIKPFLQALRLNPAGLRGAALADKVMGQAMAWLTLYAGIKSIYALVLSTAAKELLDSKLDLHYRSLVPFIKNRKGDGICPMEAISCKLDNPDQAYQIFKEKFKESDHES